MAAIGGIEPQPSVDYQKFLRRHLKKRALKNSSFKVKSNINSMIYKGKLMSLQKLSLITASLAFLALLAAPTPSHAEQILLSPTSVKASGDDGNVAANTIDNNMSTRWSALGSGQWIEFDLGAAKTVDEIRIAWHQGNERQASFAIFLSTTTPPQTKVFEGKSSGTSLALEKYAFTGKSARFIRIVGFGNNKNLWNSMTEVQILGPAPAPVSLSTTSVTASSHDGNVPANTRDDNLATRWSAEGLGQWIEYDLGTAKTVSEVKIAWYQGNERVSSFDISLSSNRTTWTKVFDGKSSGTTTALESYKFTGQPARYVRITGFGNTEKAWNSITEVKIMGSATAPAPAPTPTPTPTPEACSGSGTKLFVSPGGSGTSCTSSSPCSLNTAMDKPGTSIDIVLKDGTYNGRFVTKRNGTTIRAENTNKAILRSDTSSTGAIILAVQHSNTTIRGLQIDGGRTANLLVVGHKNPNSISNVVVENNLLKNAQGPGLSIAGLGENAPISNVTIRHNVIQDVGFENVGEGIYGGSAESKPDPRGTVSNVQIYGNTVRGFSQNCIEFKPNVQNSEMHHNICEKGTLKDTRSNDGTLMTQGKNTKIRNNIGRDTSHAGMAALVVSPGGNEARANTFRNFTNTEVAIKVFGDGSGTSEVTGNRFCSMSSYAIHGGSGVNIHDNAMNVSTCSSEEQRIINEMDDLPSCAK